MFSLELDQCADVIREMEYEDEIMKLNEEIEVLDQEIEQIMFDCSVSKDDAKKMKQALALQDQAREHKLNSLDLYECVRG